MIDNHAKENRKEAFQNIEKLSDELKELLSQMQTVSRSKLEERLPDAERKVEECRLREKIIREYYKLILNRDIQNLNDELAFRVVYSALENDVKNCFNEIGLSVQKLEYFYECLTKFAGKTKTGFNYFENKFKEEYEENTRIWTESHSLCLDIKNLNKEVNDLRVKELGDEPEA